MPKSMSRFKLMPKIRHGEVRAISAKTAAYAVTTRLTIDLLTAMRRGALAQPLL